MFDLEASVERARARFGSDAAGRRRADAGKLRLPEAVLAKLRPLLLGQERPRMVDLERELDAACRRARIRPPSRTTLYSALDRVEGHRYPIAALPAPVRGVLYNLDPTAAVPGHQLAFYCFNYGGADVMSWASGLPWLDLHQAARLGGWRPRSRGLLDAVLRVRRIS